MTEDLIVSLTVHRTTQLTKQCIKTIQLNKGEKIVRKQILDERPPKVRPISQSKTGHGSSCL